MCGSGSGELDLVRARMVSVNWECFKDRLHNLELDNDLYEHDGCIGNLCIQFAGKS